MVARLANEINNMRFVNHGLIILKSRYEILQ